MKELFQLLLFVAFIAATVYYGPSACTRPEEATRVLRQQGYKNIEITGWRPWMKAKDDAYSTGFRATSPGGEVVTGAVTGALFKGSTIRLD